MVKDLAWDEYHEYVVLPSLNDACGACHQGPYATVHSLDAAQRFKQAVERERFAARQQEPEELLRAALARALRAEARVAELENELRGHNAACADYLREGAELQARVAALEALLREALEQFELSDVDGERQGIRDIVDENVLNLCVRYGFGAVMDSAARQWRKRDESGAFLVGSCVGLTRPVVQRLRAALAGQQEAGEP